MPTSTYVSLGTITLASTDSEIVFSSIPATYRDLIVVCDMQTTSATTGRMRFNGDTGADGSYVNMRGVASAQSFTASGETFMRLSSGNLLQTSATLIIQIMDYSATDKHKTSLVRGGYESTTVVEAIANRWANTAAVNQVTIYIDSGTFNAGSRFSLYGIA